MTVLRAATPSHPVAGARPRTVVGLGLTLAALEVLAALTGILSSGSGATRTVDTTRGVEVVLLGDGLYAWDSWLVGAGNRGQDVVMLLVEVPVLLLVLRRWSYGGPVVPAVLAGVLAFHAYFWVSMAFATAQNRLFPAYVACLALTAALLVLVVLAVDAGQVRQALPPRPGRVALVTYLVAVAVSLTAAWLPSLLGTALTGQVAEAVGPYTSAATEALDLALVVPLVVTAAVLVLRRRPWGAVLALLVLTLNACIGVLLMGQGAAQLLDGVPLTVAEIVAKMATFATLTLVAGGLLLRMALSARVVARGGSGQRGRLGGTSWARS
jgi:hypothetical protein